jgi:signal transduction histidine kinase
LIDPKFKTDIEAVNSITLMPTLLNVICQTTGMRFAAVARVTEDRWITCSVKDEINFGLKPGDELKVETTICHEIRQSGEAVVIDHVENDPDFCNHHTPLAYGFQSYISMPIFLKNGQFFGTLCSIDPSPAKLKAPEVIGMFRLFADLISFHLNSIEELRESEAHLLEEKETAKLREQFIAILGHDLRNPVGAILNSAQLLLRMSADDRTKRLANIIQDSSYRMKGLIENILDFANNHLGGGLKMNIQDDAPLNEVLTHVVEEIKAISPNSIIETNLFLTDPVSCDGKRIAQLFSNLLSNAVTYGKAGTAIIVDAASDDKLFTLSIANSGNRIPAEALPHLFEPFYRGEQNSKKDGLGLGLYISSAIADAHHGRFLVTSSDRETRFKLIIPVKQPAETMKENSPLLESN